MKRLIAVAVMCAGLVGCGKAPAVHARPTTYGMPVLFVDSHGKILEEDDDPYPKDSQGVVTVIPLSSLEPVSSDGIVHLRSPVTRFYGAVGLDRSLTCEKGTRIYVASRVILYVLKEMHDANVYGCTFIGID